MNLLTFLERWWPRRHASGAETVPIQYGEVPRVPHPAANGASRPRSPAPPGLSGGRRGA
jgi:hypothetical protein